MEFCRALFSGKRCNDLLMQIRSIRCVTVSIIKPGQSPSDRSAYEIWSGILKGKTKA